MGPLKQKSQGPQAPGSDAYVEFCDATELIVTNTCFKRQNKLATYLSGGTVSTIDYLLL